MTIWGPSKPSASLRTFQVIKCGTFALLKFKSSIHFVENRKNDKYLIALMGGLEKDTRR